MLQTLRVAMTVVLTLLFALRYAGLERKRASAAGSAPSTRRHETTRVVLLTILPGIVGLAEVLAVRMFMPMPSWTPLAGGIVWSAIAVAVSLSDARVRAMCHPIVESGRARPVLAVTYASSLGIVAWSGLRAVFLAGARPSPLIVVVSFCISIGEETFYRGWLLVHWNESTTKLVAGGSSLLLFVIAHAGGDLDSGLRALLVGSILTWVTQEKNNLVPAVLLHTVANVGFTAHYLALSGVL